MGSELAVRQDPGLPPPQKPYKPHICDLKQPHLKLLEHKNMCQVRRSLQAQQATYKKSLGSRVQERLRVPGLPGYKP